MPIDKRWEQLGTSDWDAFASSWLAELRGLSPTSDIGQSVVMMNFTATPAQQWRFILAAVTHASEEEEFAHIAAGPVEHLLGQHGAEYIDEIERLAAHDTKVARILANVWRHTMPDEVWERVTAIKVRMHNASGSDSQI